MQGYSDRINHAFAFAAKYYNTRAPSGAGMAYLAHPSNTAVILARYGCDETTIVAGIIHHVLEAAAAGDERAQLEQKVAQKFGSIVKAVACDAVEPGDDGRAGRNGWRVAKQSYLEHLVVAEPRALDICVADEIHCCGSTLTALRRLGVEYLRTVAHASSEQTIWWYRSMLEIVEARSDWPRREMLPELRGMSAELVRSLRRSEEEL